MGRPFCCCLKMGARDGYGPPAAASGCLILEASHESQGAGGGNLPYPIHLGSRIHQYNVPLTLLASLHGGSQPLDRTSIYDYQGYRRVSMSYVINSGPMSYA